MWNPFNSILHIEDISKRAVTFYLSELLSNQKKLPLAWCPGFASVLWTLTLRQAQGGLWAKENAWLASVGFLFAVPRWPLRFDLHDSRFPQRIDTLPSCQHPHSKFRKGRKI